MRFLQRESAKVLDPTRIDRSIWFRPSGIASWFAAIDGHHVISPPKIKEQSSQSESEYVATYNYGNPQQYEFAMLLPILMIVLVLCLICLVIAGTLGFGVGYWTKRKMDYGGRDHKEVCSIADSVISIWI